MRPIVVLNVVGLTAAHLGPHTPHLSRLAVDGFLRPMRGVLPAVTCTAQTTMLTGAPPRTHGIVANGWYFRDLAEVWLWRQSNRLVGGEPVYTAARRRDPRATTAKMFWWYNMYADVDWSMTPRPSYPADGRKIFDSYSMPESLRDELQRELGVFPLQHFWGPGAGIASSRWIADASLKVMEEYAPLLTLVYLPHLDYDLQRFGPNGPHVAPALEVIDAEAGKLIAAARMRGAEVVVVSEYGITAAERPVHVNRSLRAQGYLKTRREPLGWETLDCGASRAFAVADHQIAHIYISRADDIAPVARTLAAVDGIDMVLDRAAQREFGLDHARSGELIAVAAPGAWFTYYFWNDDRMAPDYARTIDIHRKPGYDPVELFVDPQLRFPRLRMAHRLLQKRLGFRYLMDVIGLDATIVRGTHGRLPTPGREASEAPIFISSSKAIEQDHLALTDVKSLLLRLLFDCG